MKNQVYVGDMSRKAIAMLLEECFYIIGKGTDKLDSFHVETMINGVLKFNSRMRIDDFKEAFEFQANEEIKVDIYGPASPAIIGKIIKAYKNRHGHNVAPKKTEDFENRHGLPPSTDKDYFETLICVVEGRQSERNAMAFGKTQNPNEVNPEYYPMLPMAWAYDNVYNHLRTLNEVDEVGDNYDKQKAQVIKWLYTKYPNITKQSERFERSPILMYGTRDKGISKAQQLKESLGL